MRVGIVVTPAQWPFAIFSATLLLSKSHGFLRCLMWPMPRGHKEHARPFQLPICIYHTQDCLSAPAWIDVHLVDKKSQDVEFEPILQIGADMMALKYTFHKPLMVKFPDMWMAEGIPAGYQKGPGLLHRQICTDSGVYRWGCRRGYSFSCGLHNIVLGWNICN